MLALLLTPLPLEFTTEVVISRPPDLVTDSSTTEVGAGAAVVEPWKGLEAYASLAPAAASELT